MIRFFRNIRQKLLADNRVAKYALYAIGEIFLVVVGILLALQINNWNEVTKNREKELMILTHLREDLTTTNNNLIKVDETYTAIVREHDAILNFVAFDQDEISEGMKDTMRFTGVPIIKIVDGGLNALLNSDKLELISNDSLNLLLTEYPSYVKSFQEQERNMEEVLLTIHRPILQRHVILMDILARRRGFPKFKNRVPTSDYPSLIKDRDYQNAIYDERAQTLNTRRRARELQLKTEKLIDWISRELEGE